MKATRCKWGLWWVEPLAYERGALSTLEDYGIEKSGMGTSDRARRRNVVEESAREKIWQPGSAAFLIEVNHPVWQDMVTAQDIDSSQERKICEF